MHIYSYPLVVSSLIWLIFFVASQAFSLPIGFGRNQADLDYHETTDKNFLIYHDSRTPNEAKMVLNTLNAAKPHLRAWLEVEGTTPQTVITSAATAHASFANLVTNNLEIQTLGQGYRDLFFHEYVHNMMYHHYFNILGPFGTVIQLPWMANWWIEGLAEALSQSQGSDLQASAERIAALRGDWPTYNSLHSLYNNETNQRIGYAISGGLVSYALRSGKPELLAQMHRDYASYTMPWYALWSLVPFNGFMPMDAALKTITDLDTGAELYERYKKDAKFHWRRKLAGPFYMHKNFRRERPSLYTNLGSFSVLGGRLRAVFADDGYQRIYRLRPNRKGWFGVATTKLKPQKNMPTSMLFSAYVARPTYMKTIVKYRSRFLDKPQYDVFTKRSHNARYKKVLTRNARILNFIESKNRLTWLERDTEITRLCWIPRALWLSAKPIADAQVRCPLEHTLPKTLSLLGQKPISKSYAHSVAWLRETTQTLAGDRHIIIEWDLETSKARRFYLQEGGKPVSLASVNNELWSLVAEKDRRTLRLINSEGYCQKLAAMVDFPTKLYGLRNSKLGVGMTDMRSYAVKQLDTRKLTTRPCYHAEPHTSPLLVATAKSTPMSFAEAFKQADLWRGTVKRQATETQSTILTATPLGHSSNYQNISASDAKFRVKPVFAVPWIGVDPFSFNFGVLSVPLMEFSQNEELRLTALYGPESKYPNVNLMLISRRFWPTLQLEGFKNLSYNGLFFLRDEQVFSASYMDEVGGGLNAIFPISPWNMSLTLGVRGANIERFSGPENINEGRLIELNAGFSHFFRLGPLGFSTGFRSQWALPALGSEFSYSKIFASHSISTRFLFNSGLSLGVEYGQTRGSRTRELKELYRPLRTFVPGEGGGANNFHFELSDYVDIERGSLFSASFGDNQARAKVNWNVPIFTNLDALVWIFYVNRLDFSAFFNYGGPWRQGQTFSDIEPQKAHGYNFDLQFEIKGINFNLGVGAGQVIERPWDYYFQFSFDDIFELASN